MTALMADRRAQSLLCAIVLIATAWFYASGLDRAPFYIGGDEAHFAIHAHALATTGRDLNGTRLPVFIKITDPLVPNNSSQIWYQPFLFYALALDFLVLPVTEWSVRLPTVVIATLDVLLVYAIARKLFANPLYAVLAALMLALTPAHFLMSRQALDYICPLPFVLGWLWCLITFSQTARKGWLLGGGLLLGIGLYTYISSWIVMPFFLAVTLAVLWPSRQTFRAPGVLAGVGFGFPILLAVSWLSTHPDMLVDTLTRYRLQDGRSLSLLERAGLAGNFDLAERVTLYWDYFNPSFLFFAGGSNPTQATARTGVFLLAVSVFLVFGIHALWRARSMPGMVLLLGLAAAPAPIVITLPDAPGYSIARAMTMVPFAVLISAFGVEYLLRQPARLVTAGTVLLLLLMPLQFALFARDYYADYQVRSAPRFDPVGFRDVAEHVMAIDASARVPGVYLSDDMDDKSVRWKFYMLKNDRLDLWDRTKYFIAASFDPQSLPAGSLLVLYANDPNVARLLASGATATVTTITGVSGSPSAVVLRRN